MAYYMLYLVFIGATMPPAPHLLNSFSMTKEVCQESADDFNARIKRELGSSTSQSRPIAVCLLRNR